MKKFLFSSVLLLFAFTLSTVMAQDVPINNPEQEEMLSRVDDPRFMSKDEQRSLDEEYHPIVNTSTRSTINRATSYMDESFDTGIPASWTVIDGGTSSDTWMGVDDHSGNTLDGTPFAFVDSDGAGSGSDLDEILESPSVDVSSETVLFLEFGHYYNSISGDLGEVDVWDGTAWQNVASFTDDTGDWGSPDHQSINVSAYINSDFKVRFHYIDDGWDWYWAVDNVSLVVPIQNDLMITKLVPAFFTGDNEGTVVEIKNIGAADQSSYEVTLTDGGSYSETISGEAIEAGETIVLEFPQWSPVTGTYPLTAEIVFADDENMDNNTLELDYSYDSMPSYNAYDASGSGFQDHFVDISLPDGVITDLMVSTTSQFITSGDFVAGALYGVESDTKNLYQINGDGSHILMGGIDYFNDINAFSYDYLNDRVFFVSSSNYLYEVNPDLSTTSHGSLSSGTGTIIGMAFDHAGNLWGADLENDELVTIDIETAEVTVIGSLGLDINFAQDIGFDRNNGVLYGTLYDNGGSGGGLYTIDTETGAATLIENYVDEYTLAAVPYNIEGPHMPIDFTVTLNPGSTSGNAIIDLAWNHQQVFEDNIVGYNIYRGETEMDLELLDQTTDLFYEDDDVVAGETYYYQVSLVYDQNGDELESPRTEIVSIEALDGPQFAIDPESYMFEEVGLLEGMPYGETEVAEFMVSNAGVGTLTITDDPEIFSGQSGSFSLESFPATPYDIEGPYSSTSETYDIEVGFVPANAGLSSSLLVITDNLGRVTRTFELNGSAYNIPDYDIMENAYVITQDWQANNDFNTAMDFADFYPDYSLAPGNDVVYQFTVGIDSYFEVMENSGTFSDFAVFADGDEFTTANDLYSGTQLAIDAGTYYLVATGSGAFDFDIHIEGQEPVLVVEPTAMDLGDVPIGCWHEGGTFTVYNDGGQTITFTDATLSDENGVYTLTHDYEFPLTISSDTLEFDIALEADAEGTFEAAFLLEDENTTHIYPVTGTAYTPVIGDVICDPVIAAFDGTGHFEDNNSVAAPMHDNYHIVDGYNDVVYKFSYANDFIIDIALDNAVMDPQLALYSAADVATTDPDELTPIAEGGQDILDQELLAGTYYLVVAGDQTTTPGYTITLDVADMPDPGAVTLVAPVDGANDIPVDPTLTWELGEYTATIDVYVDTQYPPQDKVLGNADPVETFDVENLSPAQIYFWKVVAHNSNGFTESETWAFTTQLPAPLYVQGSIFDYVNVHLTWNNPFDATFKVTEDFENGEMPEGWTMTTNATGSSAGWFITDNGSSSYFSIPSHTIYAVSNDDANNGDASEDYLIMPPQDFSQWDAASLTFESFYTGDYSQSAYVEVSTDGGATYEEVYELEPNDAWTSVSVPLDDYIGEPEVYVAFHADDNGVWASGWAVDDVELAFDSNLGGGSRALIGYNVWQNGTQINDETVFVEEYDVLDLAAGDYVFGVSAVYDEGESAVTEIETITILGMSEIAGTVTDFVTGDPIESANINITGMWGEEELEYSVSTDADGYYSQVLPVTPDGYDVAASASGYVAQTEEGVMPAAAVTEVVDFALGEYPIPVSNVVAVSNEDESVATVTWDPPSGFPSYEIIYDDGIATNATAWNAGYEGNMNALKFTPSGYPCTINEAKIHIWDGTWPAGNVFNPMEVVILDDDGSGGLPGTELGSVEITPSSANWVTVDLSSLNVTISDGEFYIANRQISTYPNCPPTAIAEGTPQNRSYSYTGGAWGTASYDCFMIRATVSGPQGTEQLGYEGDNVNVKTRANEGAVAINATDKAPGTYVEGQGTTKVVSAAPENTRAVDHYEVWRFGEDDLGTPANWTLLAEDVTVTEYDDAGFNELLWGVYYYAVKAVYPITEADFAISNMLPKDIYSNALFMVTLNTGDVPEGVMVKLENIEDPEYVYQDTTGPNGQVQFEQVWKGEYLLTVAKEGYDPYFEDISITETYLIKEVELIETLAAPINLTSSVNCNVVELSWEEGQGGNFEETWDFEGAFPPDGWAMETNSSVGWFQTADGSSTFFTIPPNGSLYACSNDDAANDDGSMDYLITPEMGFTGFTAGTLTFESFYNGDYSQEAYVEISNDGGDTWSVIHTLAPSDSWEEITVDLEDYLTSEYSQAWIAFHSDDSGVWGSGWAVDNVSIELTIGAREAENREFTGFNVYRNDVLLNTAPVTETTYTDENVPGGTHDYFIAAVYTTGQSDPSNIATVEVETINPAENLTAEKQAWDNVFLDWDPPSDQAIYTLQWDDGENFTSIGTNDVFDFAVASRWTPAELGTYDGLYLTEISFFPSEVDCDYYVRVWTGSDATLVAEQLVTDVTIGEWNTVQLDTPVMIDASEEFWFGYRANAQTGYPAGVDAGPAVAGYGDMIYDAESGWLSLAESYGLDYNWNLIGTVTGGSGQQAQLSQVDETITATASEAGIGQGGINNNPVAFNMSDRALSGYNIYRDGNIIAEGWGPDFYIDYDVRYYFPDPFPEDGVTFEYNVVATYDSGCEADMSNTATAYYGVDVETIGKDAIKVYPNPAKDFVNIQLTDNVETLRVINYVGQEVYSKTITDEDIIQVERLEAGAYIVRLTTNNGETITKRFVVVK